MLILMRRQGESVKIAEDIVVTVEHIQRGQVKLSFTAPRDIVIDRMEVALDKEARAKAGVP